MNFKFLKSVFAGLTLSLCCLVSVANAGLIVVDNGSTITTSWDESFVLTRDMTSADTAHAILFENMFSDSAGNSNPFNEIYDVRATVNGGGDIILSPWAGWNYRVGNEFNFTSDALGILWSPNNLTNAIIGDVVRLYGSMTFDKIGDFHMPDMGASTVRFISYKEGDFANPHQVSAEQVPEPTTLAIFALGMIGLASRRFKKQS